MDVDLEEDIDKAIEVLETLLSTSDKLTPGAEKAVYEVGAALGKILLSVLVRVSRQ